MLLTADDRTGALESGGACADLGFDARFVPEVGDPDAIATVGRPDATGRCAIFDLNTRHCQPADAHRRMSATLALEASFRCHKMDSGLRGNWPHEVAALIAAGRRVGLLASFPAAGRRCDRGTVFIDDVPVAESAFGRDPRNPLFSSRPVDHLRAAGCSKALQNGDLAVLNANDDEELRAAAERCREEGRTLVGTTGGIGAYVGALVRAAPAEAPLRRSDPASATAWLRSFAIKRPALIVCGSLHPLSRAQIAALECPMAMPHQHRQAVQRLAAGLDAVLTTSHSADPIDDATADAMAAQLAAAAWRCLEASGASTLIVLGGDTAAATLGNRPLRVLGTVDVGVPLCRDETAALDVVTKGGGIGTPDTLVRLLSR